MAQREAVATPVRKPKRKRPPRIVVVTPDQADRERSPAQKASDRRTVNRNIAHAQQLARVTPDQADRMRSPIQKAQDRAAVGQAVAEARQKVLDQRSRGAGVRAVKKELEGRGQIAALANKIAERSSQQGLHPLAGKTLTEGIGDGPAIRGAQRFGKDLINAPAQLVPSVYIPAAAGVEALRGHPQRLKALGHQISTTDPLFNIAAAGVDAAKGNTKAASKRYEQAKKAVETHPGFAALEAFGAKGVIGRGAGAAVRGGARATKSETLRKIGTTDRQPKTLPRTNIVEHRRYSKDLTTKAIQVYNDRRNAKSAQNLRDEAKNHPPERRRELKAEARKVDPTRIRDRDIQKAVDHHIGVVDDVRRTNQAKTLSQENKTYKQTKKTGPLASLVTQRIIAPTLKSMETYRADLVKVGHDLKKGAKKDANEQLVHDLDQAIEKIKSGKLTTDQLKQIANRYGEHSRESQALLTSRGIYDEKQSERRAVTPFAVRELGAHRDPEYLGALEKAAGKTARKTTKAAGRARGRALGRVAANKRVTAADVLQQEARPLREPGALEALKAQHEAQAKVRGKQIKTAKTKAKTATAKSNVAAAEHAAAAKLRRSDPLLVEETVGQGKKATTIKRTIETPEIVAALKQMHGDDAIPGVVSQRPAHESGGGDFLQVADKPKGGETRRLGGSATLEGTLDASPERMLRQHVRARALADAHDAWTQFVDQFAYRKKDKGGKRTPDVKTYTDKAAVTKALNDLNSEGDVQWRAVRLSPFKGGDAQLQKVLEGANDIDPAEFEANAFTDALGGAEKDAAIPAEGPWAIIPEAAARQMLHHNSLMNPVAGARALRSVSSGFRRTVLGTSLPWMTGNIAEAGVRSALNRVGPGSLVRGVRISKAIDRLADTPEGAQYAKARLLGGGHYAFADRRIHANLDAYTDGFVKDITSNWRKVWNDSPAKVVPWLWDRWTHFAFNTVNKNIENWFQTGMLGRAAKDQLMPDSLRVHSQKAIDQMAKGVIDPNTARALKTEIDRMYGKYSGFSPSEKFFIANYTPFGAWYRNAVDLLLRMPERHPLTTLAGTQAVNATEEERKAQGLDIGSEGAMQAWLQGSIPLAHGAHLRATRFTPMSLATDPLGTTAGIVLPQFSSILKAFEGQDWTGQPLKTKDGGDPGFQDKMKAALTAFAQSTVPGLATAQTFKKHGLIGLPESAIGYTAPGGTGSSGGRRKPQTGFDSGSGFDSGFSSDSGFNSGF